MRSSGPSAGKSSSCTSQKSVLLLNAIRNFIRRPRARALVPPATGSPEAQSAVLHRLGQRNTLSGNLRTSPTYNRYPITISDELKGAEDDGPYDYLRPVLMRRD
jgi:hypothetical protein